MSDVNLESDISPLGDEPAAASGDDVPADDSEATADAVADDEVTSDAAVASDDDFDLAFDGLDEEDAPDVGEVADLLAGAIVSGSTQASEAAMAEYAKLGREAAFGGPLKVEVAVEDVSPTSELEQDQAAKAAEAEEV